MKTDFKEFTVKETESFRLRVEYWKCHRPNDIFAVNFINESLKDGQVESASTYNFYLSKNDMQKISREFA